MKKIDLIISGSKDKPITLDIQYQESDNNTKPVVLFMHGFKGFKDWGHFNLIAKTFVENGFVFVKLNTSHNGTTPEHLEDFIDLEAFANNNFTIESDDIDIAIQFIEENIHHYFGDKNQLHIIGHSRGGGLVLLAGHRNSSIKKIVTWATVQNLKYFFDYMDIKKWAADGVVYIPNSRTKQDMPFYYQMYENYLFNQVKLDVEKAVSETEKPILFIHGSGDIGVPQKYSEYLHNQNPNSSLEIIEHADHTFGGKHPWIADELPGHSKILVQKTIDFLRK